MGNLKDQYTEIYKDINYGPILTAHGLLASMAIAQRIRNKIRILCVGAGNAYEAVHLKILGHDVCTLDYHAPKIKFLEGCQYIGDCKEMPFETGQFDLVMCCEMLEHVPEENVEDCLNELYRVGNRLFRFTIADKLDPYGDLHLCVKPIDWWKQKMEMIGYDIVHMEIKPWFSFVIKMETGQIIVKDWIYSSGYLIDAKKG